MWCLFFMNRFFVLLITLFVSIGLSIPMFGFAAPEPDHVFPKLANTYLSWSKPPDELAKWDLLVLDAGHQYRYPAQLKRLRELNPNIVILAYITPQEILQSVSSLGSQVPLRRQLLRDIDTDWYLADSTGKRLGWWPGTYLLNVTNDAPVRNGKRWNEYLVDVVVEDLLGSGTWDGVFYDNTWDNISFFVGNNIDVDRNGTSDATADAAWREGMTYIYDETRRRTNNKYIIVGNGTTRAYTKNLNGKLIENFLPIEWGNTLETYKANHLTPNRPKINIINSNSSNTGVRTDYRRFRFGLTSALLENGYYSFDFGDQDHGQTWWYDEYDVELGEALGVSRADSGADTYGADVWRRDFANGLAVVNTTNRTQEVSLGGEFEKIRGIQDPTVNDGSIISETTLSANDGVVLLKTFSTLEDITYTNGAFARFFRPDGERVRNGFFVFEEKEKGGAKITRVDIDNNGKKDLIVVDKNKVTVWRDDGQLFLRKYPYTALFRGDIRVAVGDIDNNKIKEIIVAPGPGFDAPIKIYSRHGFKVRQDWYPFGKGYTGGYSVAVGNVLGKDPNEIILGTGEGYVPQVSIYNDGFRLHTSWNPLNKAFLGGISVAAGNLDGVGFEEIVVGPASKSKPVIHTFDAQGNGVAEPFVAYQAFNTPGIMVQAVDVDFDGKDDIVGLSTSL